MPEVRGIGNDQPKSPAKKSVSDYLEFFGCSKKANRPNIAIETIASHHGWKTIGKRTKKVMNTTRRHVRNSDTPLFPALRCFIGYQVAARAVRVGYKSTLK
jgi:hypothetical protein